MQHLALITDALARPRRFSRELVEREEVLGGAWDPPEGNISQYFEPVSTAFQADVALGSLWNVLPLRAGPRISHRQSGRASPRTENRSGPKHSGVQYAASGWCGGSETSMLVLGAKARSKRYRGDSSLLALMYEM
jgi:hypothetical protein